MKCSQAQSRWLGVAVTISTGCRDQIESRISFVLRQLLISRASRPQLIAQFPRILRTFSKFSHLWKDTKIVIILNLILLCLHIILSAILNRDSYVSLIYEIPLISEISADWRILIEASRPRSRSFRLGWMFNRIMMSPGSRSFLVWHKIFTIKHIRLTSPDCMFVRGRGVHARRILATGTILRVNLSSRLDSVK